MWLKFILLALNIYSGIQPHYAISRPAPFGYYCLCKTPFKADTGFPRAVKRKRSQVDLLVVRAGSPVEEADVHEAEKDFSGGAGNGDEGEGGRSGDSDGGGALGFVSNGILIVLWAGLIYYAAVVAPGQTPVRCPPGVRCLHSCRRHAVVCHNLTGWMVGAVQGSVLP